MSHNTIGRCIVTCQSCPHADWSKEFVPCAADLPQKRYVGDLAHIRHCPLNKFEGLDSPDAVVPEPPRTVRKFDGSLLWHELHHRPIDAMTLDGEREWLEAFGARIPCGECREGWNKILHTTPPDLSSRRAYAEWTWYAHNLVNIKLDKMPMEWEDAAKLYGWDKLTPSSSASRCSG